MAGASFIRRVSLYGFRGKSNSVDNRPSETLPVTPETQTVLLLRGARQPYEVTQDYPVPELRDDREVLVRAQAIGLNPIDWKAP
jgi:hypothetical protein